MNESQLVGSDGDTPLKSQEPVVKKITAGAIPVALWLALLFWPIVTAISISVCGNLISDRLKSGSLEIKSSPTNENTFGYVNLLSQLEIVMVNNSNRTVVAQSLELEITAEGTIPPGVTQTRSLDVESYLTAKLPDVLPGQSQKLPVFLSRSLKKGDPEKIVILLFKPDSVSINGTYTIKPRLIMFSGEVRELDAFEIVVNSDVVPVDHHQPASPTRATEL